MYEISIISLQKKNRHIERNIVIINSNHFSAGEKNRNVERNTEIIIIYCATIKKYTTLVLDKEQEGNIIVSLSFYMNEFDLYTN